MAKNLQTIDLGDTTPELPYLEIRNTWVEFPDCGQMGPEAQKETGRRWAVTYRFAGANKTVDVIAASEAAARGKVEDRDPFEKTLVLEAVEIPAADKFSLLRPARPAKISSPRPCDECERKEMRRRRAEQLGLRPAKSEPCEVCQ